MATIVTKNSSTASAVPTTSDLVQGELAVNVTDKRIFTENASTQIVELGTNPSTVTTATATVTGTLTANGTFASSNAVVTGGTINSTPIGATTPSTVRGTTVTATTGFVGGLTGNVVGNVTGNVTGNVVGNVTGDLTGNVTASTGTSTVNNLVVNGTVDFSNTRLTDVAEPVAGSDAATKTYVDTSIAAVIDGAPAALDTLNELAAALNDDASFHTTVTNALTGKLALSGGTMTGQLSLGANKIVSVADPTLAQDVATKAYVDAADSTGLPLSGGTMSGAIAMGTNKITGLGDPTLAQDAATKAYTDSILGSATSAADSAAAAATSASNASTSASNAASSATTASNAVTAAELAATNAAASYDSFDDRYLGAKASDPTVDNDGDALIAGATYFNTSTDSMKVYSGSVWSDVAPVATTVTLSQVTDFPSQSGQSGKYLSTNGTVPSWETLTTDPTLGTLTKTFTQGESSTINLTSSVLAPVVSVTKEVPQLGFTNNNWDVDSNTENYTRLNSAYDATLTLLGLQNINLTGENASYQLIEVPSSTDIGTRRLVFKYTNGTTGTYIYNGDIQIDLIDIDGTTYDFENTGEGFQTSAAGETSYGSVSWQSLAVGETAERFNVHTGDTGSSDTGNLGAASGSYFVYAETSSPVVNGDVFWLRSPEITFDGSTPISFYVGRQGDNIGTLEVYLDNAGTLTQLQTQKTTLVLGLGTGSFASADVGKTIEANDGVFVLTATDGSCVETTAPTSYDQVASGSWEMYGVVYNAADGDLQLSGLEGTLHTLNLLGDGSCIAAYTFNDTPNDLSTNYNGTWVGTPAYVAGKYGNAASFDGNDKYITTGLTLPTANFSVSVWFDLGTQIRPWARLADTWVSTSASGFFIARDNQTNNLWVEFGNNSARNHAIIADFFVTYASGWHNITAVHTPSLASVYIDGSLITTFTPAATVTNSNSLWFGTSNIFPTSEEYVGSLDQIRVFNKALSASEVTTVYNEAETVFVTGYHPVHTTASTDTTNWLDLNSMTADQAAGDGNVYYAISTDDRTTWTVIDNTDGERDIVRNNAGTWQYNSNGTYASETWVNGATNTELATLAEAMEGAVGLANAFNVNTGSYSQSLSISGQDTQPYDIEFNTDGTKMFVVGNNGNHINEYTLSTAFNVSTATFVDSFSVASQDSTPVGLSFNSDGTKMFVVGNAGQDVNEYTLSAGFDVSTASFVDSFSVVSQDTSPCGLSFNADGTKMFVVGNNGQDINEYALSTGFDVSTATYSQNFSVSSQETSPIAMAFNSDGTKMFVVGLTNYSVYQYTLTTGFDLSTASYSSNFLSVSSQDTAPSGIAFNADGSKMFITGATNDSVYEYTIGSTSYPNQMDKTQLDAVTDPNHIALGNDLDLAIVFNMTSGSTVPSSDGVAINYDATVLNKGAVLGTDYDFDAPAQDKVRITALAGNNLKVRVV